MLMAQSLNAVRKRRWQLPHSAFSYRLQAERQAGSRSTDPRLPPLSCRRLSRYDPGKFGGLDCSRIFRLFVVLFRYFPWRLLNDAEARAPSLSVSVGVTLRRREALALGGDRQGACALPSYFCPETCLSILFVCFLSEQ